jgi:hypothetical protein
LLLQILEIVNGNSGAEEKRRNEDLQFTRTLGELNDKLKNLGIAIGRTTTYYCLLPARSKGAESIKHVNTCNVRLARPRNNLRKFHPSQYGDYCLIT